MLALKTLVIEDHAKVRETMVRVLKHAGFEAVGVGSISESLCLVESGGVDVALVDLHLNGESGIDAIRLITECGVRCIALTISNNEDDVMGAISAGASGYLLKDDPLPRILSAIREVGEGRTPVSSGVAHYLFDSVRPPTTKVELTDRETDVLVALADGLTYIECGKSLGIGVGTVQTYVKRIYKKLNVSTKTEACTWAIRHGLVR